MAWHLLGTFPSRLYAEKRPSEDPEWWQWRKKNHRAITKGPIRTEVKNLRRIFTQSNYVIECDELTEAAISAESFSGLNYMGYMMSDVLEQQVVDPNAALVHIPTGDFSDLTGSPVGIDLRVIPSDRLIDRDQYKVSWLDYEESSQKKGGKRWWVIDLEAYYIVEEKEGGGVSILTYYLHNTGQPVWQVLGGWAERRGPYTMFKSWFEGYLPFANEALDQFSSYQVVYNQSAFPIRVQEETECTYFNERGQCHGGFISYEGPEGMDQITCPNCKGSGMAPPVYPGHVYLRRRAAIDEQEPSAYLEYITPPVESLKVMSESWDKMLERAKEAICARFIQEAQSGKAKEADREGQHAMIQTIAQQFFGVLVEGSVRIMQRLVNPLRWQALEDQVRVIAPTDYKLKDSHTLLLELQELGKVSTTSGIYTEKVREYCGKVFGNDHIRKGKNEIHLLYDPLAIYSPDDKNSMLAAGSITQRDLQKSAMAYHVIELIVIEQGPVVLSQPFTWWQQQLDQRIEAMLPPPPKIPTFAEAFTEGGE
jgi:hypothetical protein